MATIAPFRATRFNPAVVGDISYAVAMPYDKITPEMQDAYYASGAYNICRVSKGKEFPSDTPDNNVYTRAAETWNRWFADCVLVEDATPALYVYTQTFMVGGKEFTRRGLCAMVKLEDYESGGVKPHERTLDAPKEDRFKLITHVHAHLGQIFQLYPDPDNEVAKALARACDRPPDFEAEIDEEGTVKHRVWAVTDYEAIAKVQSLMADRPLFIADGHHRYETALNYRNFVLAEYEGGKGGHNPRFAMMTMVGMSDPGLLVLPTHRVLFGLPDFSAEKLPKSLEKHFLVTGGLSREEVLARLEAASRIEGKNAFGLYGGGRYWYFELADEGIMATLAPGRSESWCSLDVAVLHEVVLEHILGISKPDQAAKTNLSYERLIMQAVAGVDAGSHQAVILLNPTRLSQIRDVAGKGEVMPQKSTDFYPKLITGLLACRVDLGARKNAGSGAG